MKKNYPVTGRELEYPEHYNILSTTDLKGRLTYCNQDFVETSGFQSGELIGHSHNIVRHPDMPPAAFENLWGHLKAGRAWMGMVKNRCKNGDHYWVNAYVQPILENGSVKEYQSVRTKPERAMVARAERIYARLNSGSLPLALRLPVFSTTQRLTAGLVAALTLPLGALLSGVSPGPLAAGALSVASLVLGMWPILAVGRRIRRGAETARTLADNKIMQYLYTDSTDDLGNILFALKMREAELRAAVGRIADSGAQVSGAADNLSATFERTYGAIQQQQIQIEQVATAMNEMSATVQEVARNTSHAAVAVEEAMQAANTGQEVVRNTVASIQDLAKEVQQSTDVIRELEHKSADIGGVLDVIRSVAEQTNLLALNAAIEAARAGEQGRGFAVVADEVRTLASRTHQSTQEIRAMIEGLQSTAQRAVEVMEHSMELSRNGADEAGQAARALSAITEAVGTISDMSHQIASAAEEQSAVAEEINSSLVNISQVAHATATDAEATASIAGQLTEQARRQGALVAQFQKQA
jgi:aerotaxis receptor